MPRVLVARSAAEIESLRGLWEELQAGERYTLFQSFAWNLLAAKALVQRPQVTAILGTHNAAILPACISSSGLSFLGDALFDYRAFLFEGDTDTRPAWIKLADAGLPLQVTALRGQEERDRWETIGLPAASFVAAPCVLRSDTDAHSFEGRHARSMRLLRRLERAGVALRHHSGTNSVLVRDIYERKAAQVLASGENLFVDPARREFLIAAAALGSCDVFTFESAGTLVAALLTFRDGPVRRFYTTYYDLHWAHYSPGVALLFEVTRRSLADGLDCDYMTGEQPHKMRFASASVPLYRVNASAATLAAIGDREKLIAA